MLHSKSYSRKTKKGSVIKVVKEHYLRDDIYCGVSCSSNCKNTATLTTDIIIPDTNILFHQIDLMENTAITGVICLQTVLDELRNRSTSIYNRVREITSNPDRQWFVFSNEHHRETYTTPCQGETSNDRNDRAIRKASGWYTLHTPQKVTLITNDVDNKKKALAEGIDAVSLSSYIGTSHADLQDLISATGDEDLDAKNSFSYNEHLSATQISAGLKSGAFYQGVINICTHNYLEATMMIKMDEEKAIRVVGRECLNRAVQGDVVAVQILPKSQWTCSVSQIVEDDQEEKPDKELDAKTKTIEVEGQEASPCAKVVGIIKRSWRPFCGTIDKLSVQETSTKTALQSVFFWSMDRRIPKIRIRTRQAQSLLGKRIMVAIDAWSKDSRYPAGHFIRVLGEVGDRETETQVLLLEHDVPFAPFSTKVLSYLPVEGDAWIVKDEHLDNRQDFRHLDVCSIDPPGCTDIDDALHAFKLPNGNFQVGVHIADVSHFCKDGNAMDAEAQRRGTTGTLS
jgi:exosome complex exonuclease DIS3/RRP44